jgi:hypothetical protein
MRRSVQNRHLVNDVVAVEVRLTDSSRRYFVTWGRIQDPVDPKPLCDLVLKTTNEAQLGGAGVDARLCDTLREAATSESAPYFYECLLKFSVPIPFGEAYEAWRLERDEAMRSGREIAYCGSP